MPYTGERPATDDTPYALQEGVEIVSVDWGEETYDEVTGKIGLDPLKSQKVETNPVFANLSLHF